MVFTSKECTTMNTASDKNTTMVYKGHCLLRTYYSGYYL